MTEKQKNQNQEEKETVSQENEIQNETSKEEPKELTLEEKLEKALAEKEEAKNKWLRTLAEFDNFRKRSISEKSDWIKNATKRLVLELCEVSDNFERAINAGVEKHQFESFLKGVELIFGQLNGILEKEGVKKIEAMGQDFDPNLHEALAHIPSEFEENKVAAIIKNGYVMNDKVVRPAQVAVSNGVQLENKENEK